MYNKQKVVVVMPAYNAEKTLEKTYNEMPLELIDDIILVDDASIDNTVDMAKKLNLKVMKHEQNLGYGGNQKTCYKEALKIGADIIIMLHPDYQYDPKIIPNILEAFKDEEVKVVFASRMLGNPLKGGMPLYKFVMNKMLTGIENLALGTNYSEFHTGYRAYRREVLEKIPFEVNSNGFIFDNEIIVQLHMKKFKIKEIPVKTMYGTDSSSVNFINSVFYGLGVLKTILKYILHKKKIKKFKKFDF